MGGGTGMGNTCKPLAVSFQCMTKSTTNKKKRERERDRKSTEPRKKVSRNSGRVSQLRRERWS